MMSLDKIVDALNNKQQRAIYGAVAKLIVVPAIAVTNTQAGDALINGLQRPLMAESRP